MQAAIQAQGHAADQELVRAIAAGDRGAFEQLMRRHNRTLFRTARAILGNDAAAEDALQDAYLRAFRALSGFRGEARLSTWLVRIVANEALARRRQEGRRAAVLPLRDGDAQDHDSDMESAVDPNDTPEDQASRGQLRRLLERGIDALPDNYRVVFMLRAVEEFTVEETATALDLPEATVRSRLFRARGLLREALAREIDVSLGDAFSFDGERCDRVVARVLARLDPQPPD